jgi:hypothetical protein
MALDFIAGKSTYSGLRIDGLLHEDNPLVIIPPHSLKTFTWFLGGIMEGETVTLAAAVFADGKEEGERVFLDGIKKARVKFQEKQRAERAKNGGQNETKHPRGIISRRFYNCDCDHHSRPLWQHLGSTGAHIRTTTH